MMSESALTGDPPANEVDKLIVQGFLAMTGRPDENPSKGLPSPPRRPPKPSHESRASSAIASLTVAIVFVVSVTLGRILVRWKFKASRLGWDDLLIVVACISAVTWFTFAMAGVFLVGVGRHIYNNTYMNLYWYYWGGSINAIIFFVTVSFTKLSIICFNWRLTGGTSRGWQWVHRIFFVTICCYLVVALLWITLRCTPPAATDSLVQAGIHAQHLKCLHVNTLDVTLSSLHVAYDWMLLSIPIIILIHTNMALHLKLRCIIPLSLGVLSCVGSVMRLRYQLRPLQDLTCKPRNLVS